MNPLPFPCILVAEDQALIRMSICEALSQRGYQVLEASDGAEALRLAGAYDGQIQVLVSDVQMPGLDGLQLVQRLKPERPDLRILLLSALPEQTFPAEAQYDAYLPKPVSPQAVVLTVGELLQGRGEQDVLPEPSERVKALLAARRGKSLTLEQWETKLKSLSTEELQQISQALLHQGQNGN